MLSLFLAALPALQDADPLVVHAFVPLCDNRNQGIVRVPAHLGNGQDPAGNLYWGARYGLKTFFRKSPEWKEMPQVDRPADSSVLDRAVFLYEGPRRVLLIADAYDGAHMREALTNFLAAAAGRARVTVRLTLDGRTRSVAAGGGATLVAFTGHNGLMDVALESTPSRAPEGGPAGAVVLACKSASYFSGPLSRAGCPLLLGTRGLMAPEAYTLDAALRSWAAGENADAVRRAAAAAYARYQRCSPVAARRLFAAE
jgi:hypothetical protein